MPLMNKQPIGLFLGIIVGLGMAGCNTSRPLPPTAEATDPAKSHEPNVVADAPASAGTRAVITDYDRLTMSLPTTSGVIIGTEDEWRTMAEANEAAAQHSLGLVLLARAETDEEVAEGIDWLKKASVQDYPWALTALGSYYDKGKYVIQNRAQAVPYYERAAILGYAPAAARLGYMYQNGLGVPADATRAAIYLTIAAERGHSLAKLHLAHLAVSANNDMGRALVLYRELAGAGFVPGMEQLVNVLNQRPDLELRAGELFDWARRGANVGSRWLRAFELKMLLQRDDVTPEEVAMIVGWNRKLAATEDKIATYAAYDLGYYYWSAAHEPFDLQAGLHYFEMAARRDMPGAISMIAHCKTFGVGTPRNLAGARILRDKLAELSKRNPEATQKMIRLLDRGLVAAETEIPVEAKAMSAIHRSPPNYPMNLRRAGVEGEALIDFEVQPDGFVDKAKVIKATHPEFGAAALLAVSAWRMVPKREDGSFVPTHMQMPIVFTLGDDAPATAGAANAP